MGTDIVQMVLTDKGRRTALAGCIDGELKKWRGLIEQGDPDLLELTLAGLFVEAGQVAQNAVTMSGRKISRAR
ncbi:MAG: hypothetical protein R3C44_22930 [Chloroflexota bacterium]